MLVAGNFISVPARSGAVLPWERSSCGSAAAPAASASPSPAVRRRPGTPSSATLACLPPLLLRPRFPSSAGLPGCFLAVCNTPFLLCLVSCTVYPSYCLCFSFFINSCINCSSPFLLLLVLFLLLLYNLFAVPPPPLLCVHFLIIFLPDMVIPILLCLLFFLFLLIMPLLSSSSMFDLITIIITIIIIHHSSPAAPHPCSISSPRTPQCPCCNEAACTRSAADSKQAF